MTRTLVLVHTVPPLVSEFSRWCREILPDVRIMHVLDEPLLERIRARGASEYEDEQRLAAHVALAADVGASAVLVTCSTVSLVVDSIAEGSPVPVVKIDEAMAREAVRRGGRIAVVATNPTTTGPSRELLLAEAVRQGRAVDLTVRVVDGALAALLAGDEAAHDALVERAVRDEARHADVVVLAQASMARVAALLENAPDGVPVLASPLLALEQARRILFAGVRS